MSFVSHGAHADFAPGCDEEMQLAVHVGPQVARLTVELLLSNAGLVLIYRHLRKSKQAARTASARRSLARREPGGGHHP